MASWKQPLAWALVVVALLGANAWVHWHNTRQHALEHSDYDAFMQAAGADDAIDDPLQRCLQGPDLPRTHWHRDTTELYCRTMLQPTLSFEQIDALLTQGKADEVDQAFDGYLRAHQSDLQQPGMFDQAFVTAGFDSNEEAARQLADRWKQASPQSAAALTASGMQYLDQALGMPAPNWNNSWPDAPDDPTPLLALARKDLERAIALQPADTMAYRELMLVDAIQDDPDAMTAAALGAQSLEPANFGVRAQLMNLAQPSWGSAFGGMNQQLRLTQSWLPHNALLRIVLSKPAVYAATCCDSASPEQLPTLLRAIDDNVSIFDLWNLGTQEFDSSPTWAAMLFTESLRFRPRDAFALHWRAEALLKSGDRANALNSIQRIASRYPQDNPIQLQLGWMAAETGHPDQAERIYLGVLQRDPGNQRAMAWLGDLYNRRLHQPAKAMPLAQQLITRDPDNPEGHLVQIFAEMQLDTPDRYTHIHDFIRRFGELELFQPELAQMRDYLRHHPRS
ncbi:MAG TPA: tetratricopeptide repeat protein [Dyella sp.]|uniref:tetratricopeptide repeat protein n=1 Tax=Dyella sp. TaxID=1869338 RepID=UPI002C2C795E|nr:tetratricopeptide repeat protein [Dyella sp.]HTV85412.1 tetratricopeptide repeat protein [Dyella sp.]